MTKQSSLWSRMEVRVVVSHFVWYFIWFHIRIDFTRKRRGRKRKEHTWAWVPWSSSSNVVCLAAWQTLTNNIHISISHADRYIYNKNKNNHHPRSLSLFVKLTFFTILTHWKDGTEQRKRQKLVIDHVCWNERRRRVKLTLWYTSIAVWKFA